MFYYQSMNNFSPVSIVGWKTRSKRRNDRAVTWCKDYGLKLIVDGIFVGELYAKEKVEIRKKFQKLFINKTDKFFLVSMCKSCFNDSVVDMPISRKQLTFSQFELVQTPENG